MIAFALTTSASAAIAQRFTFVAFHTTQSETIVSTKTSGRLTYLQVPHPVRTLDVLARVFGATASIIHDQFFTYES
jgi:hypothetical protein